VETTVLSVWRDVRSPGRLGSHRDWLFTWDDRLDEGNGLFLYVLALWLIPRFGNAFCVVLQS